MQRLYHSQLMPTDGSDESTREKETALLKLGELYRDQKCALPVVPC